MQLVYLLVIAALGVLGCSDATQTNNDATGSGNETNGNNNNNNSGAGNTSGVNIGGNGDGNGSGGVTDVNSQCPPAARPVYAVEADVDDPTNQGTLLRFDAEALTFTEIGQLACPAVEDSTPFSMSVDREANAWVLYNSGELFKVSTADASCEASGFNPGQSGYSVFGMGFVLNQPDSPEETLYVAGGSGPASGNTPRIGYVTFPNLALTDVAEISGWPEMSGTADAELWGFFPGTNPPRVSRVVPATGAELDVIPIDGIDGDPNAWAFAHWGGQFFIFYKSITDESTRVFRVTKAGVIDEVITDSGRYIVGAGVSTCAPTTIL